jgi:enoyl-CoA hydratase/carnithine racemase
MVPSNIACETFLLGEPMTAQQALDLHLVNRVVPADQLEAETRALANVCAMAPQFRFAAAKQAVYASEQDSLDRMLQYEVDAQMRCFASEDGREGVRAFLESVRRISPEGSHRGTETQRSIRAFRQIFRRFGFDQSAQVAETAL